MSVLKPRSEEGYVSGLGLYPPLLPWASGDLPGGRRAVGSRSRPGH